MRFWQQFVLTQPPAAGTRRYPVCGHGFVDNNNGAETFCKQLGYATGTASMTGGVYSTDAMPVGRCKPGEALEMCSDDIDDGNGWGDLDAGNAGGCKQGKNVAVEYAS